MSSTETVPDIRALRDRAVALGYTIDHRTVHGELEDTGQTVLLVRVELTPATAEAKQRLDGHGDAIVGQAVIDPLASLISRHAAVRKGEEAAAHALAEALRLHDQAVGVTA